MLKRNFPQLLLVVLFVGAATVVSAQEALPDLIRQVKPSVVSVTTFDAKGESLVSGSGFFVGELDEVVVASTLRPAEWLVTAFRNQCSPATFFTIGPEETR